jgi:predicted dehydrogenase
MKEWNIQLGFSSIDEILNLDYRFDVISICSPTTYHSHDIKVALQLSPKLIFCEKPMTTSLHDTERLVEACKTANVMIAVNHTRRWDPAVSELQADILSGRRGELRSIVGIYNKGILNNGSHMLDLLNFLVGPVSIINVGKPVSDYLLDDPTIPVWLESEQGVPIHLVCAHAEDYAIFELQLIFSLGVLTMEEGGLYWRERRAVQSTTFKGYRKLDDGARYAGEYPHAMIKAIDNIYRAVTRGDALVSNGESALLAQRLCEKIKQTSPTQ